MINLLTILVPFILYDSGIFWILLFLSISFCRYRFNRNRSLFFTSFIGNAALGITLSIHPFYYPLSTMAAFNIIIIVWSLIYNIKVRIWKQDVVFFTMELILILALGRTLAPNYSIISIVQLLFKWTSIYITFQVILIIVKLFIGYQVSTVVKGKMKKLKLLIYCLPRIEASFALNDLSAMGVNCAIFPGISDVMIKEVEFLKKKVLALEMRDRDTYEKATKEHEDYYKKNFVTRVVQKIFSRIR